MSNTWLEVAKEALKIPGLLVEIYGDLAKPGVRQVGKALDTILGLGNTILWPIVIANERSRLALEANLEKYRKRLEFVPEAEVIAVAPEIGVPISEKLSYVQDDKLTSLYIELLAKASSAKTVSDAHPSFVNVINNLSPDEAHLLESFVEGDDLQFVRAIWKDQKNNVYSIAGDLLISPEVTGGLMYATNVPAYICNLAGLGLATIHYDRQIHASELYPHLEATWRPKFPESLPDRPERVFEFDRGVVCLTEFGKHFISACHRKPA